MTAITKGTKILVREATHTGHRHILGRVTQALSEGSKVTHITVAGHVTAEHVRGLALPIEPGTPVTLEMIPVKPRHTHLLAVKVLG